MKIKAHQRTLSAALLSMLLLCLVMLVGCGGNDSDQEHFYMMEVQTREYLRAEDRKLWNSVNKQFRGDEVLQFWSESQAAADGGMTVNIYLSREDGSSELMLKDMPKDYRKKTWWLDQGGNLYCLHHMEALEKFDENGDVLFRRTVGIRDVCQLEDGRILLLVQGEEGALKIAELDGETGAVTEKDIELKGQSYHMGSDGNSLVLMDSRGFWRVDLSDGSMTSLMNFAALSYRLEGAVYGFRLFGEGEAEILKQETIESLRMADISETRKLVVFRNWKIDDTVKRLVYDFNHMNEEHYVMLEECDENTSIQDFRNKTGIDLAAGRGADIIVSDAMPSVMGYIQNGVLEDLTPYIERSGMRKEDFFPAAFSHWTYDGKIYGVETSMNPTAIWIDEEVLGGREVPDVKTLVAAMLNYKGNKKWYWDSDWILNYLIRGSEDIWGLIDWEEGNCDFTGELFADILKAAKMHGGSFEDENVSAEWAHTGFGEVGFDNMECIEGSRVYVGFLFDDGAHALVNEYGTIGISSSSRNKEGAWAFLCYLLGEEVQREGMKYSSMATGSRFPVRRDVFNELGSYLESNPKVFPSYLDVTIKQNMLDPEWQEKVRVVLEGARFAPIKTAPIRSIIRDEADWYFDGTKSLEEVCGIIQNRVKLYLDENR